MPSKNTHKQNKQNKYEQYIRDFFSFFDNIFLIIGFILFRCIIIISGIFTPVKRVK